MKSGFVSLIGRPNVGKSTLLNNLIGRKVAITSAKAQTTRNIIQGIYHEEEAQIVFVDTPGIHKPKHTLGKYLNKQAYYSIGDVDVILFLVDASEPIGPGDKYIIERLKEETKPVILILNKIDKLHKEDIIKKIIEYKDLYPFVEIVPVSALKSGNTKHLIEVVKGYLTDSVAYYSKNDITNKPTSFLIAEMIREKIFHLTEEEVPHSITCVVEEITKGNNSYNIIATIIVDRDSLKGIIIGARGSKLKEIGMRARLDMQNFLGKNVYLDLHVKTVKKWRDKEKYLSEFGYNDFE